MDACRMQLSGKIDLAQSREGRQLCWLVSSHGEKHCKIIHRHSWNAERPHEPNKKNVRSTKLQRQPFETANVVSLRGKKERDIFTSVYEVRETIFSDQRGQFPTRSQHGNKYVMVMVEVDSNAILLEPMKSHQDNELIRAYNTLVSRLICFSAQPKKHVLDNEILNNMKITSR